MQRAKAKRKNNLNSPSCVEKKPRQHTHHWEKSNPPVAAIFSNPPKQAVVRGRCWNWKLGCFTQKSTNRAGVWWDWRGTTPSKVTRPEWIVLKFIRQLHPNSQDAEREKGTKFVLTEVLRGKRVRRFWNLLKVHQETHPVICARFSAPCQRQKKARYCKPQRVRADNPKDKISLETCTMVLAPREANHPCPSIASRLNAGSIMNTKPIAATTSATGEWALASRTLWPCARVWTIASMFHVCARGFEIHERRAVDTIFSSCSPYENRTTAVTAGAVTLVLRALG